MLPSSICVYMRKAEPRDVMWRIQLSSDHFKQERSEANGWVSYDLCANTANSDKHRTLPAVLGKTQTTWQQSGSRVF